MIEIIRKPRKREYRPKACGRCNAVFTPTGGTQKFCDACRKIAGDELERERARARRQRQHELTEQNRAAARLFRESRESMGFVQRSYWVHHDDAEVIRALCDVLRERRMKERM